MPGPPHGRVLAALGGVGGWGGVSLSDNTVCNGLVCQALLSSRCALGSRAPGSEGLSSRSLRVPREGCPPSPGLAAADPCCGGAHARVGSRGHIPHTVYSIRSQAGRQGPIRSQLSMVYRHWDRNSLLI